MVKHQRDDIEMDMSVYTRT